MEIFSLSSKTCSHTFYVLASTETITKGNDAVLSRIPAWRIHVDFAAVPE
jgi:hypothetical protein